MVGITRSYISNHDFLWTNMFFSQPWKWTWDNDPQHDFSGSTTNEDLLFDPPDQLNFLLFFGLCLVASSLHRFWNIPWKTRFFPAFHHVSSQLHSKKTHFIMFHLNYIAKKPWESCDMQWIIYECCLQVVLTSFLHFWLALWPRVFSNSGQPAPRAAVYGDSRVLRAKMEQDG